MLNGKKKVVKKTLPEAANDQEAEIVRVDNDGEVKIMANEILGVPTFIKIGHKNGDIYDNRRCNLYIIDPESK